jgi:DNA end-binding protein Ku
MALRPYKSATITFGLVSIPVKFYTATKGEDVSFNLLHEGCGSRVNRKWWCPEDEKHVEQSDLIRAFQFSKGRYVTFTDEEIEALESDDERALEITEFLSLDQIDPVFFEKAYYLGPADGGSKTYALLASAMRKQGKVALARWVSGHREHLVILRPFDNGIILHRMFYADEVRDFGALDVPGEPEVKEKELKLAEMLINELTESEFDPLRYKDEYRERLMERIEAKSRGEVIVTDRQDEGDKGEVIDIMEALRRSLEAPKKRGPALAAKSVRLPAVETPKKKKAAAASAPEKTARSKRRAS